ncbi:MAG: FkbM family methyltransferase [Actinomycetota bacterium]|nr:FkbM family methyltransferase [Actinomycetota bacterium]
MQSAGLHSLGRQVAEVFRLARRVSRLGADGRARALILVLGLSLPIKRRISFLRPRGVRLRLRKLGQELSFTVADRADYVILDEVLVAEAYDLPELREPRAIVDLGANVGASVAFFHLRYPQAIILACEPSPAVFSRLQQNVGAMKNVSLRRTAVTDRNGSLPFRVSDESLMSSLDLSGPGRVVTVEARTLDDLMVDLSLDELDLLKIDIEGAEFDVLRSFSGLDRTRAVVGEVHLDLMEQSLDEFFALLEGFEVRKRQMALPDIPGADRWLFEARRTQHSP